MNAPAPVRNGVRVDIRRVWKSFNRQPVLRDINLAINAGEIFVVMGPSGSGKTVLLKHVVGLEKPDQGEVLIQDEPIDSIHSANKFRLGMVFQSGALLNSLTAAENVGLYLTEHRAKPEADIARIVREKLELVGLKDIGNQYPAELSGGMKKRVAIARALVMEPQLLLYDEPTGELDPLIAVTIAEEIVNLNRRTGATSLVVTHDRHLALFAAHRLAILYQGEIVAIGTPAEVKQSSHPIVQKFLTVDLEKERKSS